MLSFLDKSLVRCAQRGPPKGYWDTNFTNDADLKSNVFVIMVFLLCLYNVSKMDISRKFWQGAIAWLNGVTNSDVDKRITAMTSDLKIEMRELSKQISEFHKWTMNEQKKIMSGKCSFSCKQCKEHAENRKTILSQNLFNSKSMNNRVTDCNWLQYLYKYVYVQSPRIIDTDSLENVKQYLTG